MRGLRTLLALVPAGAVLDDARWRRRHRVITAILLAHWPLLALLLSAGGASPVHAAVESTTVALFAAAGALGGSRRLRTIATVGGLLSASAILVHATGGIGEAHFHFFIVVGLAALYRDRAAFVLTGLYVVLHHGVLGSLAPRAVYDHPAAWDRPWLWAAVHAGAVFAAASVHLVSWHALADEVRAHERTSAALELRRGRHRQAAEINDNVVQGLVVASMALEAGELRACRAAIESTLASAQQILTDLFDGSDELDAMTLRRSAPAEIVDPAFFSSPPEPAT